MTPERQDKLDISRAQIESLVTGNCGDPFALLGPHALADQKTVVRVLMPDVASMTLIEPRGGKLAECTSIHPAGLWTGTLQRPTRYRLRAQTGDGPIEFEDAYRFGEVLGEMDVYLLAEGTHLRNYERLGAHPTSMDGVEGTAFAVWAPGASRVSVVGDFCNWDGRRFPMRMRHECGVWELFVPHVGVRALYKFEIKDADGALLPLKADPYALRAEHPPRTASIVHVLDDARPHDEAWMSRREA
ncbi:MAG: GlgB N-terminal domain-containing protein, partial [Rhodanobacteraceae bacterium]